MLDPRHSVPSGWDLLSLDVEGVTKSPAVNRVR